MCSDSYQTYSENFSFYSIMSGRHSWHVSFWGKVFCLVTSAFYIRKSWGGLIGYEVKRRGEKGEIVRGGEGRRECERKTMNKVSSDVICCWMNIFALVCTSLICGVCVRDRNSIRTFSVCLCIYAVYTQLYSCSGCSLVQYIASAPL